MKDNTVSDRKNAGNWFSKIDNDTCREYLEPEQWEMLKLMVKIGEYSGSPGSRMSRIGSAGEIGYARFFADIREMVSGDMRARVGKDYYALAVYQQAAYWIEENCMDFAGDGVRREEMESVLDEIEKKIDAMEIRKENANYGEYEKALAAVGAAERTVERI